MAVQLHGQAGVSNECLFMIDLRIDMRRARSSTHSHGGWSAGPDPGKGEGFAGMWNEPESA